MTCQASGFDFYGGFYRCSVSQYLPRPEMDFTRDFSVSDFFPLVVSERPCDRIYKGPISIASSVSTGFDKPFFSVGRYRGGIKLPGITPARYNVFPLRLVLTKVPIFI